MNRRKSKLYLFSFSFHFS